MLNYMVKVLYLLLVFVGLEAPVHATPLIVIMIIIIIIDISIIVIILVIFYSFAIIRNWLKDIAKLILVSQLFSKDLI